MIDKPFSRTRIAPTPSGYLHLGNIYSFTLTWLAAKMTGASIVLRIDDLDSGRRRTEYIDDIFRVLELAGISCDAGPAGTEDFLKNHSQHTRRH
ncbi:MAG: glutamate--tRNA ligase family protein, partial [Spirochaetota bacterium]